jgi:1,2-diacylglycerol 3-beta-glucosyltransferase
MSFQLLIISVTLLYFVELSFYAYAALRSRQLARSHSSKDRQPKVSIVVAAKDEEKNLPACLDSLTKLDYPPELFEIIVVNDQSCDSTPQIVDDASKRFSNIKRIDAITIDDNSSLRGKANALSQGIDKANGEFIFLTDADCIVPSTWIRETLKYFEDDVGIVGGVTLISKTEKPIYGIQAIDWDILLTVGAGAATVGRPVGCLGNNLAFRKKAYEQIGGYRNIKFSVTEDFALFKAIASSNWNYRYPMDRLTLVETLPVESLIEVFSQRKRWATGGKDTGAFGFLTLAPGFIFHWLLILSPLFSFTTSVIFFAAKLLMDTLFILPTLIYYGKITHLKFIFYFEIYYILYVAILPFSVYFGKGVTWKGRRY